MHSSGPISNPSTDTTAPTEHGSSTAAAAPHLAVLEPVEQGLQHRGIGAGLLGLELQVLGDGLHLLKGGMMVDRIGCRIECWSYISRV